MDEVDEGINWVSELVEGDTEDIGTGEVGEVVEEINWNWWTIWMLNLAEGCCNLQQVTWVKG